MSGVGETTCTARRPHPAREASARPPARPTANEARPRPTGPGRAAGGPRADPRPARVAFERPTLASGRKGGSMRPPGPAARASPRTSTLPPASRKRVTAVASTGVTPMAWGRTRTDAGAQRAAAGGHVPLDVEAGEDLADLLELEAVEAARPHVGLGRVEDHALGDRLLERAAVPPAGVLGEQGADWREHGRPLPFLEPHRHPRGGERRRVAGDLLRRRAGRELRGHPAASRWRPARGGPRRRRCGGEAG